MLLFALHLAQQLVAALGFRNKDGRALDAGDGAGAGFLVGDLQQVVGEGDAGDVVERAGVDGDAGEVVLAQLLEELLERDGAGNGEDGGARRHHLADQLVAELDGGADQFAVALFEDSLFFAGFEQRLDIDGGLFFRR